MGFLDNLKDRFRGNDNYDDYDEGYDDGYYDDGNAVSDPEPRSSRRHGSSTLPQRTEGSGLLGNTPRPEAESVSVYTRSGRPVASNAGAGFAQQQKTESAYSAGHGYAQTPAPDPAYAPRTTYPESHDSYQDSYTDTAASEPQTSAPVQRVTSGQLPPYILKPESYDDVQMVIRRVRTNQPVVLVLTDTPMDTAKRVLDFSFGLACGIGGEVEQLGESVFSVLPAGITLTKADVDKLIADGDLKK